MSRWNSGEGPCCRYQCPHRDKKCTLSVSVDHTFTDFLLQAVQDNKDAIEELIIQTAERLLAVNKAIDEGIPDSAKPRMTAFAG